MPTKPLSIIHQKIIDLLKVSPGGLTVYEIREKIPDLGVQQHLDKRIRELRDRYNIPVKAGGKYVYEGEKTIPAADDGAISAKLRAAVLNAAHGRCQMCGRTIADDNIKLQADHKIPRTWGGKTEMDNLWALCQLCNGGKRDFFANFDDAQMQKIVKLDSVYARLAEILNLNVGKPVESWVLEFVANVNDFQEDWQKRLRELRYPGIDMIITITKTKNAAGKVTSAYTLQKPKKLPTNHRAIIAEGNRKKKA